MARLLEEKLSSLYRAGGKIVGGVYVSRGQEAFSASLASQLTTGKDVYGPLIRDQAGRLAFGENPVVAFQTFFGSPAGPMRGRDGNVHRGEPREGIPAMISHLGSLVAVVCGMLMARRMKGVTDCVGATSIGDGATSTGSFHEALNTAAVEKLPLVIGVANNQFAYSTPNDRQFACDSLVDRAIGYGIDGFEVDGTDLAACLRTFQHAVARARAGHGPQMVVGSLLRLAGHGEHDDASYIPDDLKKEHFGRDCLEVAREQISEHQWANVETLTEWENECRNIIDTCVQQAGDDGKPDPYSEDWSPLANKNLLDGYLLS